MPHEVIDRVHAFACRNGGNSMGTPLELIDRDGNPLVHTDDDDSNDESYNPNHSDDGYDDDEYEYDDNPNNDHDIDHGYDDNTNVNDSNALIAGVFDNDNNEYENEPDEEQTEQENNNEYGNEIESQIPEHGDIETEPSEANEVPVMTLRMKLMNALGCVVNYNFRPRRPHDYSHLHTTLESIIITQYSMKKGINLFGEAGIDAVLHDLQQFHNREVIKPKNASELSGSDKEGTL